MSEEWDERFGTVPRKFVIGNEANNLYAVEDGGTDDVVGTLRFIRKPMHQFWHTGPYRSPLGDGWTYALHTQTRPDMPDSNMIECSIHLTDERITRSGWKDDCDEICRGVLLSAMYSGLSDRRGGNLPYEEFAVPGTKPSMLHLKLAEKGLIYTNEK
jgi:hypothetical protein